MDRTKTRPLRALAPLLAALFFVSPALAEESFSGRVIAVTDGDRITVRTRDNYQIKVLLHGVDCPDLKQPFGQAARQFTSKKVLGKEVYVDIVTETERDGRTVGNVSDPDVPGKYLNHSLVRNGYALWSRQDAPYDTALKQLENEARQAKRGLWGKRKRVVGPGQWRRGVRR